MANYAFELVEPRKETGQYRSLIVPNIDGLSTVYVDAGKNQKGIPRAWQLIACNMSITTSADVANRTPYLLLLNEFRLAQGGVKGKSIAASSAGSWDVFTTPFLDSNSSGANNLGIAGIGDSFIIQGDGRINCYWINGNVNDVASYHFIFKWLPPRL